MAKKKSKGSKKNEKRQESQDVVHSTALVTDEVREPILEPVEPLQESEKQPLTREDLFHQGLDFDKQEDFPNALKCFMACLSNTGALGDDMAKFVTKCLDDDALRFARAEKAIYETILLRQVAGATIDDDLFQLLRLDIPSTTAQSQSQSSAAAGTAESDTAGPAPSVTELDAAGVSADDMSTASAAAAAGADAVATSQPRDQGASAPAATDRVALQRRIAAYDQMARLMERHQKIEMARQYALRAIELRQELDGPAGMLEGLETYNLSFADLGREEYKVSLDRYRLAIAKGLEEKQAAAQATDRDLQAFRAEADALEQKQQQTDATITAPAAGADDQGPFVPIDALQEGLPRQPRSFKRSMKNLLLLLLIFTAITAGLLMVVYGLGVVQDRGLFVSTYDDTVFNGIKLNVRDAAPAAGAPLHN